MSCCRRHVAMFPQRPTVVKQVPVILCVLLLTSSRSTVTAAPLVEVPAAFFVDSALAATIETTTPMDGWCPARTSDSLGETQQTRLQTLNIAAQTYDWEAIVTVLRMTKQLLIETYAQTRAPLDTIVHELHWEHAAAEEMGNAMVNALQDEANIPLPTQLTQEDEILDNIGQLEMAAHIWEVTYAHAESLSKMATRIDFMRRKVDDTLLRGNLGILYGEIVEVMCRMQTLFHQVTTDDPFPPQLDYSIMTPDEKVFILQNTLYGEGLRYGEIFRLRRILHFVKHDVGVLRERVEVHITAT